jgi:C-terminal processing protease CtpA/Prc
MRNFPSKKIFFFRDYGIFITNIIPGGIADKNGRLKVGDRLMHVQSLVRKSFSNFLSFKICFFVIKEKWL